MAAIKIVLFTFSYNTHTPQAYFSVCILMNFLPRTQSVNLCTTRYLASDNKNHLLCNVLKGGSTSWQRFLDQNQIPTSLLAECVSRDGHYTCPGQFHTRILQVRHPMERLLGTWRHVFKNGGWKLLEAAGAGGYVTARAIQSV